MGLTAFTFEREPTARFLELGYALEEAKEWRVLSPLAPFAPDFHTHVIFARDEVIAKKP